MLPLTIIADLAQWSYWVVVAGSGVIGAIMVYLLLPSRLQILGRPTVRFRSEAAPRERVPLRMSPGSDGEARATERGADPTREARARLAEIGPIRAPSERRDREDES